MLGPTAQSVKPLLPFYSFLSKEHKTSIYIYIYIFIYPSLASFICIMCMLVSLLLCAFNLFANFPYIEYLTLKFMNTEMATLFLSIPNTNWVILFNFYFDVQCKLILYPFWDYGCYLIQNVLVLIKITFFSPFYETLISCKC